MKKSRKSVRKKHHLSSRIISWDYLFSQTNPKLKTKILAKAKEKNNSLKTINFGCSLSPTEVSDFVPKNALSVPKNTKIGSHLDRTR